MLEEDALEIVKEWRRELCLDHFKHMTNFKNGEALVIVDAHTHGPEDPLELYRELNSVFHATDFALDNETSSNPEEFGVMALSDASGHIHTFRLSCPTARMLNDTIMQMESGLCAWLRVKAQPIRSSFPATIKNLLAAGH